ncbi:MAG: AAA family ATPase, partial [bacterium]
MKQIQYILCVILCVMMWPATSAGAGAGAGAGGSSGTGAFQLSSMPEEESAQPASSFLHYAYQQLEKYQDEHTFFDSNQKGDYLADLKAAKDSYERDISRRCEACCLRAPALKDYVLVVKKQITDALNDYIVSVQRIRTPKVAFNVKAMVEPNRDSEERMKQVFPPASRSLAPAGTTGRINYYVPAWPLPSSYLQHLESFPYSIWSMQKRLSDIEKHLVSLERQAEEVFNGGRESFMAIEKAKVALTVGNAETIAASEFRRQQQLADGAVAERLRQEELRQRGDNDIRVQTTVGTALEDARTKGARAVQGDRDAAHAARHGKIIAAGKWMLVAAALSAVGGMGAYFGFRHVFKERPKIIRPQDTSISFGLKKAKYPPSRLDKLILPPALQKSVMQKFQGMEFAITKGLPLSNMLFYGPPGVGKSLAAQEFVRSLSDKKLAHHIIIRGPAFQQFKRPGQAVSAIRAIFEAAENSYKKTKKPTIIDFEEAE